MDPVNADHPHAFGTYQFRFIDELLPCVVCGTPAHAEVTVDDSGVFVPVCEPHMFGEEA